jgi:hypothetical protein
MNITEFTDSIKFFLNKDLTVRPCTAIEHFWLIENIAPDLYSPFLAIEDEKQTDYYFYQILNLNTVGKILVFSRDAFVKEWDSVFDFLNFLSLQHDSIYVNKIRLLLLKYWDPIGVGAIPESKFEYDIYINQIIKLLKNKDYDGILKYLLWAEVENMGLLANIERV